MRKIYTIYADICCLNRPLDDTQQSRIKLEAEAMIFIFEKCQQKEWILVNSDVIEFEIMKNTNPFKKEQLENIISLTSRYLDSNEIIEHFTEKLLKLGFKFYDALHLSFCQYYQIDVFLSTDDRLLKKAKNYPDLITIKVENPVIWLMTILQEE